MIKLFDRIKETSHSTGTGIFNLDGAADGFSRFNEVYSNGDVLFYAITDGTRYEIGSGVYSANQLTQRFPFRSTNSDQLVNFSNGLKEVYVTYPAKYSVFTGSGHGNFQQPQSSGIAFWENGNTLSYDPNIIWDKNNNRLGISVHPEYLLDVGGLARTSGLIVRNSGIWFSGSNIGYTVGVQLEPFLKNVLNVETGTDAVFELSGIVNQGWLFKKQQAGTFFAGPPSGCGSPPCPDDYPSFRAISVEDVPNLSDLYVTQYGDGVQSNIALYRESGVIEYDPLLTWNKTFNYLGVNKSNPTIALDVVGEGKFTSELRVGGDSYFDNDILVSGGIHFASGNTSPVGLLSWDNDEGTLSFGLKNGNIALNIGQENVALCYNGAGVGLTKSQVVYVSGAQGQRPKLNLASALDEYRSTKTFGLVAESISAGQEGFVTTFGIVRGLNTSAFGEGSGLWLSTTPGAITMSRPVAPYHGVFIGYCVRSHGSAGEIFVNIQNGHELDELHDVLIQNVASGDIIQYDSSLGVWRNRVLTGGSSWTISDQSLNNELITTQTVYFSGSKGIETYYDLIGNTLHINPTALSGYFENKVNSIVIPSGGDSWTIDDGRGGSELISTQTVYISGVSGIQTTYSPSTNILTIDAVALSGYFENKISSTSTTGIANKVAFFDTSTSITSDTNLHWDNTNKRLGIGRISPATTLDVLRSGIITASTTGVRIVNNATSSTTSILREGLSVASSGSFTGSTATSRAIGIQSRDGYSVEGLNILAQTSSANLYVIQNAVIANNTETNIYGVTTSVSNEGNSQNKTYYGYNFQMTDDETTATTINSYGVRSYQDFTDNMSVGSKYGFYSHLKNSNNTNSIVYGLYSSINLQAVPDNNSYGCFIVGAGASKINYGIYTTGTLQNYFDSRVGINQFAPTAMLHVQPTGATVTGVIVRGQVGQTADYLQIQSSISTPLLRINSAGSVSGVASGIFKEGIFDTVLLNKTSVPQIVANSGNSNTIVNASGYLVIPTFDNFCQGYNLIGSGSSFNKGVLFFTTDSGRMYISNGSGWMYSSFTLINEQCGTGGGGGGGPI